MWVAANRVVTKTLVFCLVKDTICLAGKDKLLQMCNILSLGSKYPLRASAAKEINVAKQLTFELAMLIPLPIISKNHVSSCAHGDIEDL